VGLTASLVAVITAVLVTSGCSSAPPASIPASTPTVAVAGCPAGVLVSSSDELSSALASATPGSVLLLAPGTYSGHFTATTAATAAAPLTLCGNRSAVIDGGALGSGYALHLDGAQYWSLIGFSVTGAQKGILLDNSSNNTLSNLSVTSVGDEAVHLRAGSSDNLVENNTIGQTGLAEAKFGEGIYVGTAQSNWCTISNCNPDQSDRNRLVGNTISATTAENVDIKEGTTGGQVTGNSFDGSASTEVDSLIDVKGNNWMIDSNTGQNSPVDGAQVHVIVAPWGSNNTFAANSFAAATNGFAVNIVGTARDAGNVVLCDNEVVVEGSSPSPTGASMPATAYADGVDPRLSNKKCQRTP
jgi:parallel beta-helix repeat protein